MPTTAAASPAPGDILARLDGILGLIGPIAEALVLRYELEDHMQDDTDEESDLEDFDEQ